MELNLRERIGGDPVRYILGTFGSWWGRARGWRKVGIGSLVLILFSLFLFVWLVILFVWLVILLVWLVRGLTIGGMRNRDLYLPKVKL